MSGVGFAICVCCYVLSIAVGQSPELGLTRAQLQPLTEFRQQRRKTVDGRLCAAAFVQNRKAYTDCTAVANPAGESGRPWCYVKAQVRRRVSVYFCVDPMCALRWRQPSKGISAWNHCGASVHLAAEPLRRRIGPLLSQPPLWIITPSGAKRMPYGRPK